LVTVFSAPNYCNEFDNQGALMSVDEELMCSFKIIKSTEAKSKPKTGGRPETPNKNKFVV